MYVATKKLAHCWITIPTMVSMYVCEQTLNSGDFIFNLCVEKKSYTTSPSM